MPSLNPQSNSFISAITDQPVLVAPDRSQLFGALVQELAANPEFASIYDVDMAAQGDQEQSEEEYWADGYRPYVVTNGVLQIQVSGVLLNRFSRQFGRWATGYQYIEKAYNRGMEDPQVSKIALLVDSGGGEVAGLFELVEKMVARRGEKPVKAFANDHAYSAAYAIASAASSIVMSRSGGVGSVGIMAMHTEYGEMYKEWGIKITFIFAGKYKVDGNRFEKLSKSAKKRMQAKVDRTYGEFVALVANNRDMEEQAVRDTEALTYDASEAIEIGFADKVGAFDEEMAAFTEEAAEMENEFMAIKPKSTPASAENTDGQTGDEAITQTDHDAAVATASAEGSSGERMRINAILDSEEGKARPAAALSAAMKTSMSADEAIAFLGGLPEEKATQADTEKAGKETPADAPKEGAKTTPFTEAMNGSGNPEVGAEAGSDDEADDSTATSASMLNALAAASGKTRKTREAA